MNGQNNRLLIPTKLADKAYKKKILNAPALHKGCTENVLHHKWLMLHVKMGSKKTIFLVLSCNKKMFFYQ